MRTALLLALSFSLLAATATAAKGPRPRGQENLRLGRATIAVLDSMHATGKPMSQELYVAHDGTRGKLATAYGRATLTVGITRHHLIVPQNASPKDQARAIGRQVRQVAPGMTAGQMRDLDPGFRANTKPLR